MNPLTITTASTLTLNGSLSVGGSVEEGVSTKLDELVSRIRAELCLIVKGEELRDACGFKRLDRQAIPSIMAKLTEQEIGCASELMPAQNEFIFLFDYRATSPMRKLLDLANTAKSGMLIVPHIAGSPWKHDADLLREAARALERRASR